MMQLLERVKNLKKSLMKNITMIIKVNQTLNVSGIKEYFDLQDQLKK